MWKRHAIASKFSPEDTASLFLIKQFPQHRHVFVRRHQCCHPCGGWLDDHPEAIYVGERGLAQLQMHRERVDNLLGVGFGGDGPPVRTPPNRDETLRFQRPRGASREARAVDTFYS